jgi:peptidoglycan/xylan/chitin deacetylase (PgdA/CDA1 family)
MTRFPKRLFLLLLCAVLALGAAEIGLQRFYVVPIIMYHRVAEDVTLRADTVSQKYFEYHLNYFRKHRYQVLTMDEFIDGIKKQRRFSRRSVVLTFDDGTEDNFTLAYPILKRYGYPAIIFVSAEMIGQDGYLTWDQIRNMGSQGIAFGSHGLTHVYLPNSSPAVQRVEIEQSKRKLEQELKQSIKYIAYPIGGFNDNIKSLVRTAGYQAAVTTNRGQNRLNQDLFQLNRIRFSDKDNSAVILWVKLSGYYNIFRKPKSPD